MIADAVAGQCLEELVGPAQGYSNLRFLFEDYVLDTERRELRRGAEVVPVAPQVFDLLEYLIRNRERVVSKDDLIAAIWKGGIVSEAALTSRLNIVRGAIGDSGEEQRLIRTLPRKGFRFVGTVREEQRTSAADAALAPVEPTKPVLALPGDAPAPGGRTSGRNSHQRKATSRRAVDLLEAHMRLDPFYSPFASGQLGFAHYMLKQHALALPALRDCASRSPNLRSGHVWLAATYAQLGQLEEARAAADEVLRIQPDYTISGTSMRVLGFKFADDAEHFFDGLRQAGLPE